MINCGLMEKFAKLEAVIESGLPLVVGQLIKTDRCMPIHRLQVRIETGIVVDVGKIHQFTMVELEGQHYPLLITKKAAVVLLTAFL